MRASASQLPSLTYGQHCWYMKGYEEYNIQDLWIQKGDVDQCLRSCINRLLNENLQVSIEKIKGNTSLSFTRWISYIKVLETLNLGSAV